MTQIERIAYRESEVAEDDTRLVLQARDKGCDIDVTYADAITRGIEIAQAEFGPEICAEHGEAIIQEGKDTIYFMHIYGLANHPLAHFLDGADAYVSCEIEKRDGLADRFASLDEYPVRSAEQRHHEGALWAALTLLNPEVYEALLRRMEEEEEEADAAIERAESGADDEPKAAWKSKRRKKNWATISEDAVALRFAEAFSDALRYCHSAGAWHEWNKAAWTKDQTANVFDLIRAVAREVAAPAGGDDQKKAGKASFAAGVERFARADRALAVKADFWDRNPMLLGTPGGTVDLKTGVLRPSDRADGITKLTAVTPAATADCPIWLAFLHQATNGNAALIRFLQQWCGYCLTGDISEHALLFIYGPGGNGKGVFLNTVAKIFDAYHKTAPMETFTASNSDRHTTDLAGLHGARHVGVSETEEGKAWAESKIKSVTGGDPVSARFMRQDFFEYEPQYKLTIIGNHKPRLRNVDDAARRRLNIVPFIHKPAKVDPYLGDKLKAEWPAILRWAIDGCLDWQKNRLVRPKVVTDATAEYFEDQDSFAQWLEECCDVEIGNRYKTATSDDLFASWSGYARAAGIDASTKIAFGEKLRGANLEPYKNNGQRGWRFVQVRHPRTYGQKDDE